MPSCSFAQTFIWLWLHGLAICERQRALALQIHLDVLSSALSPQPVDERETSDHNIVPFRRSADRRAVVLELR
jgi:hypothetical protein